MINAEKVRGIDGLWWIKATYSYNKHIDKDISSIEGALHDPDRDVWAVPYVKRDEFQNKLSQYLINWVDEPVPYNGGIDEELFSKYPEAEGYSVEYGDDGKIISHTGFKVPPWADFQVRAFNAIYEKDRLILADEMGLGKTWEAINGVVAKINAGISKRVLVVVKASLLYMWRDEIHRFSDKKAIVLAGTPTQRHNIFKSLYKENKDWSFLIVGYEMFRGNVAMLNEIDDTMRINTLILDEAHKIKNPLSKIGERIGFLPYDYVYLLTATPLLNDPLESFNYLRLCKDIPPHIEGNYVSQLYWNFRQEYGVFAGYKDRELVGYRNMNELREYIQRNMLRRTKQEKLPDLPDVVFNTINLEMTKEQTKYYKAVTEGIIEDLQDTDIHKVPSFLAKLTRLQQVADSPALIGADVGKSVKEIALRDLIEDIVDEGGEKVVIFTRFRSYLDIIVEQYSDYNPAVIHGEVSSHAPPVDIAEERAIRMYGQDEWNRLPDDVKDKAIRDIATSDRQHEVDRFQNDHRCKLFFGTTEACKEGLTLTAACNVIFLDYPWNWASYSQAYSRTHRIGQENAVTVHNLICEDTIDEKVFNTVLEKKSMSEVLIDTKVGNDSLSRQQAIDFIKSMI